MRSGEFLLRIARAIQDDNQTDLAKRFRLTQASISQVLNGGRDFSELTKIAIQSLLREEIATITKNDSAAFTDNVLDCLAGFVANSGDEKGAFWCAFADIYPPANFADCLDILPNKIADIIDENGLDFVFDFGRWESSDFLNAYPCETNIDEIDQDILATWISSDGSNCWEEFISFFEEALWTELREHCYYQSFMAAREIYFSNIRILKSVDDIVRVLEGCHEYDNYEDVYNLIYDNPDRKSLTVFEKYPERWRIDYVEILDGFVYWNEYVHFENRETEGAEGAYFTARSFEEIENAVVEGRRKLLGKATQ